MDGAAHTIVSNVGRLVGEEYGLLRAVGDEVVELRGELGTMNALLRMHSEADDGAVDHFIREWMKQVRELSYDAEDCVDLYILRIKCRPGDGFLVWSRRMLATLFPRHLLAGKIKAIRVRAVTISERHARYAVGREALRRPPPIAAVAVVRPPTNVGRPHQLVGIQEQANDLAGRVKAMNVTKKLRVFSIVGFGGLGKTTLATEVCRRLEPEFARQAIVSVSQAFDGGNDLSALLRRVLQQMGDYTIDGLDEDGLARRLRDLLNNTRYLIVIDDVWTIGAWNTIRSRLPADRIHEHDSRIIITTRIENVARECSDPSADEYYIHHMEPLTVQASRELFLNRAFDPPMDDELETIMYNILNKCAGLPLAIVSIASLLASYKYPESRDMWETISNSIGLQMENNPALEGMTQILTLSYNHLPYHLKGCMMYLSIFPEDYEINRDRLLYRWIAEGLVEKKRGLTLMEVAGGYFDELLSRNMIIPVSYIGHHWRREDFCRVHDMMLEIMVSKSLEANLISLLGGQYEGMSYDRIRRLSIHGGCIGRVDLQHVRSLSMFKLGRNNLFDRLGEFTLLRVLDLEDCQELENKHVEDICGLYLLRFLSMKDTNISVLPEKVGKLEHLQVLDVDETNLEELPKTMTRLEKLERVRFRNKNHWDYLWKPTRGLSKMQALQEVDWIFLEDVQVAREIGELGQLREISIYVGSLDRNNRDIDTAFVNSLSKLYSLRSLGIGRFGRQIRDPLQELDFLLNGDMPPPPRLLRALYLDGAISQIPNWVMTLRYLVDISFIWSGFTGDQVFGVLWQLPNLKNIIMRRDSYIGPELVAHPVHRFPVLRTLSVCSDLCLNPQVLEFQEGSMDSLEELSVHFGVHERHIVGIEHLNSLKEVKLFGTLNNDALGELRMENERRGKANQPQFAVVVRY